MLRDQDIGYPHWRLVWVPRLEIFSDESALLPLAPIPSDLSLAMIAPATVE